MARFKANELLHVKMETKETLQKEFQRKRNEVPTLCKFYSLPTQLFLGWSKLSWEAWAIVKERARNDSTTAEERRSKIFSTSTPSLLHTPWHIQELEASLYTQRQLVLQELELIRQREDHLAKQSELTKLQSSDLHSTSERLKHEEQILKR